MSRPAPGVHPALPATEQDALDWFDTERDCLLTLLRWTADQDWNEDAWRIAWSMDEMLRRRGHVHDRVRVWESAVFAAERLGAADVQCLAYGRLAHAHDAAGDHAAALPARRRALALAAHLHDRGGQAQTHRTSAFPSRAGVEAARARLDASPARPDA
ncbi:transcriptional regulator, SARP family [[Actinomadura] parvosata subsp. kistnae]|nr:transcriptional regulator, SARP family [Actinomadura parvosata subsp. kistnae]